MPKAPKSGRPAIPVNPEVLRWARESLRLPLEEVARRLKKTPADIEAWERGDAAPTYVQLETLAYDIYHRPVALFFFPAPPAEESVERTFRALPDPTLQALTPRMRWLIRKAQVLQANVRELRERGEAPRRVLRDADIPPSADEAEMARRARDHLGVSLSAQGRWGRPEVALTAWREAVEDAGVAVFKDSFNAPGETGEPPERYSGFCLYDPDHPLIYLNNNDAKTRQVFTLFHELGHLLLRTGAIDVQAAGFSDELAGGNPEVEVRCNRFAAEFLVPARDLAAVVRKRAPDEEAVEEWAWRYGVSRETILRRLADAGRVSKAEYRERARRWSRESRAAPGGGDYYRTKGAYLGERYVRAVFRAHHRDRLSIREVASYLDVSVRNVDGMEAWLFSQHA